MKSLRARLRKHIVVVNHSFVFTCAAALVLELLDGDEAIVVSET